MKDCSLLSCGLAIVSRTQLFFFHIDSQVVPTSGIHQWLGEASLPATLASATSNIASCRLIYLRENKTGRSHSL